MIAQDHSIITLVVIVAIVVILAGLALDFGLSCYRAQKVDHLVIQHLSLFVVGHAARLRKCLQTLANAHGEFRSRFIFLHGCSRWHLNALIVGLRVN